MGNDKRTIGHLLAGLALMLGRYPVSWLLSSRRGSSGPKTLVSPDRIQVTCPSGNTLHVGVEGSPDAQPLVLIHGLNSSSRQWYYQRLFFRQSYRLIIIDLPGR